MFALKSMTTVKNTGYLDPPSKSSSLWCTSKSCSMSSVDPATNARSAFGDVSNTMPLRPGPEDTSMEILPLSHSLSDATFHPYRVSDNYGFVPKETRHDTSACTRDWKAHNSRFCSPVTSSSLSSNRTTPEDNPPIGSSWSCFAPNRLSAHMLQTAEHLCEDMAPRFRDVAPLVPPGLATQCRKPAAIFGLSELLVEGQRRVIGATPVTSFKHQGYTAATVTSPVTMPVIPGVTVGPFYDDALLKDLAEWTSDWLYKLILEPHIQQGYKFQYHGKPHQTSAWVARRLSPVIRQINNPVQVVTHALSFIGTLASDDTGSHVDGSLFSVPFFRHLRAHGTYTAEDFLFRAFIVCAMIGDKSVNDITFTTKRWTQLSSIPRATLNALEKIALTLLEWEVVMTDLQWQETIVRFRAGIKRTDPFGPMAHLLDEMATLSGADDRDTVCGSPLEIVAPQPIRAFTQWQLILPSEWCPEDDPIVNQKPRTIGIAPGADQRSPPFKHGTTAKDLLDMILGSSGSVDFAHIGRSAGTSFYGSFGAIGARVTETAKHTLACPSGSWIPVQR